MKTKKILGMLLALTMVFSMLIIPQTVVQADYSDNVILEYDFEDLADYTSVVTALTPQIKDTSIVTKISTPSSAGQGDKLFAVTDPATGNTYLRSGAENATTATSNSGFGFMFKVTSGTYAISFDIGRMDKDSTVDTPFYVMSGTQPRLMAASIKDGKFYGYTGNAVLDEDNPLPFEKNKIYRVDVVIDLDSKYAETSTANGVASVYVDGQLLIRREYTAGLSGTSGKSIFLRMDQPTPYLDNVKVAKVTNNSFEVAAAEYANNTVTISFTESLLTEEAALAPSDFTVTNATTGDTVAVAAVAKTAYDKVALTFADGAIKNGFTYNVAFSTNVKNIAGNNVTGTTSFELPAEEKTAYVENFDGFKDGEIVVEDYEDTVYNSFELLKNKTWKSNPFKSVTAVAEGNDGHSIRITRGTRPTATTKTSEVTAKLPHKIYLEGDVAVEYRIRASADLTAFKSYIIGEGASTYQVQTNKAIPAINYEGGAAKYSSASETLASGGFHTYKIVYHFDDVTADAYLDGDKINAEPIAIANYSNIACGYFDRVDMRIEGENETSYVDIDYIKVTQTSKAPYVTGITYKDYNKADADTTTAGIKEIAVSFGGNVSEASLENITIMDGETPVEYEGAFDAKTRTYTMTIPGLLAGNKVYTLNVTKAVTDPYNAPIIAEKTISLNTGAGAKGALTVEFSKEKAEIAAGDKVEITATIIDTTGAAAENYALIAAVNSGTLLSDVDLATLTWNGCVGTAKATVTVENTTDDIKAFVLESLGTLAPVAGSPFVLN